MNKVRNIPCFTSSFHQVHVGTAAPGEYVADPQRQTHRLMRQRGCISYTPCRGLASPDPLQCFALLPRRDRAGSSKPAAGPRLSLTTDRRYPSPHRRTRISTLSRRATDGSRRLVNGAAQGRAADPASPHKLAAVVRAYLSEPDASAASEASFSCEVY